MQDLPAIRLTFSLLLVFAILGCQLLPSPWPFAATGLPASETPTLPSAPTAASAPGDESIFKSFEDLDAWDFAELYQHEDWPAWIVPEGDIYKLDENYEVESIELTYSWFGLDSPAFDYQQMKRLGDGYSIGGQAIPQEKIRNLLRSIRNLHPMPQSLLATAHTDDYPFWDVALTGKDGTKVLLSSTSNAASFVPWNVVYNNEIYAQFDSEIPNALNELFAVETDQTMARSYSGGVEDGRLEVISSGWLTQMDYGFNGLFPFHTVFYYQIDPQTGEVRGTLDRPRALTGTGRAVVGVFTDLEKISLEKFDKSVIDCSIEPLESRDSLIWQWSFTCPVEAPGADGPYLYPMHITFGTDRGASFTADGTLFGNWRRGIPIPRSIFPREVAAALHGFEPYQELVRDHAAMLLAFEADVDLAKGRLDEAMNADIVFLGQLDLEGRLLPYSVTTSFAIQNGKVVRWDLDVLELQAFLLDVLNQQITRTLIARNPEAALNLFYFEQPQGIAIDAGIGSNRAGRQQFEIASCGGLPWRENLPDEQNALREFSIGTGWDKMRAELVLIDNAVRVLDFRASTSLDGGFAMTTILPDGFIREGGIPMEIRGDSGAHPHISFSWAAQASQADISSYTEMIEQLPGSKWFYGTEASVDNVIFVVNEAGTLDLIECK